MTKLALDMSNIDWRGLVGGFLKFVSEEMREKEHQDDDVEVTGGKPIAAGVLYCCRPDFDGRGLRVLLLKRSAKEENYAGHWAIPGGGIDPGETPEQAAKRECSEEIGRAPDELDLLKRDSLALGDEYLTFRAWTDDEFEPQLNAEHTRFKWVAIDGEWPSPIHPAVKELLEQVKADDGMRKSLSMDDGFYVLIAADEAPVGPFKTREEADAVARGWEPAAIAMDKATVRTFDADGRMHVAVSHISKATVSPYFGKEIPGHEEMGLKPDGVYHLLRDPQELAKAAPTFNNLPLLSKHVPVTADDFPQDLVVGSLGTDATFAGGYLDNSIVVWNRQGIDLVESKKQKQLSAAYRYKPDMTPGTWNGMKFDGVMRSIIGNHVALVETGRAGPDVVIGDSDPFEDEWERIADALEAM